MPFSKPKALRDSISKYSHIRLRPSALRQRPNADLDATVGRYVAELVTSAPEAVAAAKRLIAHVAGRPAADVADMTADTIARHRVSAEGQGGMRAFLGKRPAPWVVDE